jgi:hypothetical protein
VCLLCVVTGRFWGGLFIWDVGLVLRKEFRNGRVGRAGCVVALLQQIAALR